MDSVLSLFRDYLGVYEDKRETNYHLTNYIYKLQTEDTRKKSNNFILRCEI